jgi:hypothetical protein
LNIAGVRGWIRCSGSQKEHREVNVNQVSYRGDAVRYWYDEGSFEKFKGGLRRAVGQYARNNQYIYIGLTQQQPEIRFAQHQKKWASGHQWDSMIVVYHGRDANEMQAAEYHLINFAKDAEDSGRYGCQVINDRGSQMPQVAADPNGYWVYICLQKASGKGGLGR